MSEILADIPLKTTSLIKGAGFFMSQKAETQILKVLENEKKPQQRLRVSVNSGGCSGFQYNMNFDETSSEEDIIFSTSQKVEVIMDGMTYELLQGSTIDYIEELIGAAFVIKNPNAMSSCGCGNSFSVI